MNFLTFWMALTICLIIQSEVISQSPTPMNSTKINGLRTTIYKVDDLQEAVTWYSRVFELVPYFNEPFYAGFNIGGFELGLLPEVVAGPRTANVLSYWGVGDIRDTYDKMVTSGAKELEAPNEVGGGIKVALLKDPWQNVIGLIHNPYFQPTYPDETVIEWASFKLSKSASIDEFKKLSKRLDVEFLSEQKGFIHRNLLKKSETEYVDLIFWENEECAKTAMANAEKSELCSNYFTLMELPNPNDPNSALQHFQLINY